MSSGRTSKGGLILDVRTAEEFAEKHAEGAVNVPVDVLSARLGELETLISKSGPILVYCRSGRRSAMAKQILEGAGYAQVEDCSTLENAIARNNVAGLSSTFST
jgi:phage shock protein E